MTYVPTEADKARRLESLKAAAASAIYYGATPDEVWEAVEVGVAEAEATPVVKARRQAA